jgi:hypothetical protein
MKSILVTAVMAALVWLQPACNGGSDAVQSYQVGPSGGTFESPDGVKLEIPQGALDQEIEITVTKTSVSTDDFDAAGDFFEFGPAGTTFTSDITLTIPYDPQKAAGPEENLRLWYSDSASGPFSPLPGNADTTAKTVSGSVNHFSFGAPGSTTTVTDCGNGTCEGSGETCTNCPQDCPPSVSCCYLFNPQGIPPPYPSCSNCQLDNGCLEFYTSECSALYALPFVECFDEGSETYSLTCCD